MTTTFRAPGDTVTFTAAGALTSGDGMKQNALFGVVHSTVASGETAVLMIEGVFELPVLGSDVVAVGELLYWDNGNSRLTKSASGNTAVAKAAGVSGSGVTTVEAKLLPGLSTT